jgi:hypothetical protein
MVIMHLKMTFLLFSGLLITEFAIAQPAVLNGNNYPPLGRKDTASNSTSSTVSPGSAGANITWNLSTVVAAKNTVFEIVTPASTQFAGSYPSANKVVKCTYFSGGAFYHYKLLSSSRLDGVALGVTSSGALDYTPNPKTYFPIPFHYNDVFIDTFQLTTSAPGTNTITYDGYGTVITPYGSSTNVIRYKTDNGTSYSYTWLNTNPLMEIATYYSSSQQYYFTGAYVATGISETAAANPSVIVYPNPATDPAIRISSNIKDGRFILTDMSGKIVREINIRNNQAILNKEGIAPGLYSYVVSNNNVIIAKGRLTVQ